MFSAGHYARAPIGEAVTLCDFALRLMRCFFSNFGGSSGYPSIAAMPGNRETDAMCQFRKSGRIYSITSLARPSSESGMVRPSVFAILRLMTNSTFTACWTGRPAGLAPLRILPA
jgi:hypothetical protein